MENRGKMFDALLQMHGIGIMVGAGGTASTPVDLGVGSPDTGGPPTPVGYTEGKLIIDVTACSSGATTEDYELLLQGSHDATFTTFHTFFGIKFGAISTGLDNWLNTRYSSVATWPGPLLLPLRISQPFSNDFAGVYYRWLRLFTAISATTTTGINYYAFLSV